MGSPTSSQQIGAEIPNFQYLWDSLKEFIKMKCQQTLMFWGFSSPKVEDIFISSLLEEMVCFSVELKSSV